MRYNCSPPILFLVRRNCFFTLCLKSLNRNSERIPRSSAAGLASELKIDAIPYGRRFPVACCGELQFHPLKASIPVSL